MTRCMSPLALGSRRTRRSCRRARPGVALVMALVAMAVLGALVAGVFFAALQEQRDGRDAVHRVQALAAAEYGLAAALSPESWRPSWNNTASRGPLYTSEYRPDSGTSDTVRLWKLQRNTFLLISAGTAGPASSGATRRIALAVTLRVPLLAARAAVIAMNGVSVGDSSLVSGSDTLPPTWSCPPADDERPAVIVPAAMLVDTAACTGLPCLAGAPAVSGDPIAAGGETYERLGAFYRDSIASGALQLADDVVLAAPAPALDGDGECDVTRLDNLGDPLRLLGAASPCADYFPALHASGNMRIDGGAGQGVLLVDHDLTLAGGARFSGVVAVRGLLDITESSEVQGAILASRVIVQRGSRARYSSCAVERALRSLAVPVVPEGFAWSEMY